MAGPKCRVRVSRGTSRGTGAWRPQPCGSVPVLLWLARGWARVQCPPRGSTSLRRGRGPDKGCDVFLGCQIWSSETPWLPRKREPHRAHLRRSRPSLLFPVGAQCVLYLSPAWPLRCRLLAQAQMGTGLALPAGHPAGRPVCCHPGTKSCPADLPVQTAHASQGVPVPRLPPPVPPRLAARQVGT